MYEEGSAASEQDLSVDTVVEAAVYCYSLEEGEHAVVKWFQWLLEKLPNFDR